MEPVAPRRRPPASVLLAVALTALPVLAWLALCAYLGARPRAVRGIAPGLATLGAVLALGGAAFGVAALRRRPWGWSVALVEGAAALAFMVVVLAPLAGAAELRARWPAHALWAAFALPWALAALAVLGARARAWFAPGGGGR